MGRQGSLSEAAIAALGAYAWPGNLRELRNVLERALLLARGPSVEPGDLRFLTVPAAAAPSPGPGSGDDSSRLTLEELARWHIERVLREEKGHVELAARRLGVPRSSLYKRIRALAIDVPRE
jgi:transcriptional regulator of acetoin/glycerol metabolism